MHILSIILLLISIGLLAALMIIWTRKNTRINALEIEKAGLQKELEALKEKSEWLRKSEQELENTFEALASKILRSNSEQYINRAKEQIDKLFKQIKGDWGTHKEELKGLVDPLGKNLEKMEKQVNELEQKREGAYEGLIEQITQLGQTQRRLESAATGLTQALKSSSARGRWGEVQLRRLVEMVGMVKHVDFEEQIKAGEGRPDMIIHLPQKGIIPVDSKAPMGSYLDGMEAEDEALRQQKFKEHAKSMRAHMKSLAQKAYWEQFQKNVPEFVVMVVPYEGGLAAAFRADAKLLDDAINNKVIIVSPVTLLALLKVVAYGWLQIQLAESARDIAEQGKQLYERLLTFAKHIQNMGKHLNQTTGDYNKMVGSLQRRVLPAAEKLKEMGAGTKEVPEISEIDSHIRELDK